MLAWLQIAPAIAVALAIIAALGLPIAFALRLRGFAIAIIAVPAAFASIAITSIAAPMIGMRWNIVVPLVFSLVLAAVLFALRRFIGRPAGPVGRPHRFWIPVASAAIGGAVIAFTLVRTMKSPGAIMQTHDAIFHYNLIRNVLDEGSANSLAQTLTYPDSPTFYPMLWHAFTSLIVQLSGASIPVASNAMTFIAMAVVWPIGAVALARAIVGPNLRTTLIAGALSAAFPMFPYYIIHLSPNMLSYTLAPFALVASLQLLNIGRSRNGDPLHPAARWLLLLGASGAAVVAHPTFLHSFLVWLIFPIAWAAAREFRALAKTGGSKAVLRGVLVTLALIVYVVVMILTWHFLRTSWTGDGTRSLQRALINIFSAVHNFDGIKARTWVLGMFIVLGAAIALRRRAFNWLLGTAALFAGLYIISAGSSFYGQITALTAPWYHRPRSIAALMVWVALPLVTLLLSKATGMSMLGLRRFARMHSPSKAAARLLVCTVAAFAMFALLMTTQTPLTAVRGYIAKERYSTSDTPRVLSPDEIALLSRMHNHVPEGSEILGNPWTGTALVYAIAGYSAIYPQGSLRADNESALAFQQLRDGDPAACKQLNELDAKFLLDFGTVAVGASGTFAPLNAITDTSLLTELDREGDDAVLYEITGCD